MVRRQNGSAGIPILAVQLDQAKPRFWPLFADAEWTASPAEVYTIGFPMRLSGGATVAEVMFFKFPERRRTCG
jgi:hypothetical protein